ncbi:MAG: D-alanine--D-alanine ligase [Planctomycetes bacterium]|nr:D-alanine--D-alanine ligase [Planctomycetota bacterium]
MADLLDITVLMGGPSSEREVSLASGTAIADALERRGHKVLRRDITPDDVSALDREDIDVAFIALHGEFGESGQAQKLCEARGLRYTGSPPGASARAMNKDASKHLAAEIGLDTPEWMIVDGPGAAKVSAGLPLPSVIKPIEGGSSIDITIARTQHQRHAAIDYGLKKYGKMMVEAFVGGREMTVGILGGQPLPALEIMPARAFYDYTAKYADGAGTRYTFDLNLPEEVVRRMQMDSLAIFRALGCRDMSRIDFILDGANVPQFLEINTIPGFTGHSLLPMAARRAGVEFDEMVERIARMAAAR